MKYAIITALFSFLLIYTVSSAFAHGEEKHNKKTKADTVKTHEAGQMDSAGHAHIMEEGLHNMLITRKEKAPFETFPTLHPLIVHFPIVLLLIAFLTQLAGLFVFKRQLNWVTFFLVFGGLIGAYVAAQLVHPHTSGLTDTAAWVLEQHEKYAAYTLWTALAAFILKTLSVFVLKKKLWLEIIIVVVLGVSTYSVGEAGHYGSQLLYLEGVGAQGNFLEQPSLEESHSHEH
ncbi:MAG: hypothetical protein GXO86_06715 [Chlorobi bacterium]|nr:hypothetical protein [Chlorobiota bacterium]